MTQQSSRTVILGEPQHVLRFHINVRGVYWSMRCIDSLREVGLELWQHYKGIRPLLGGAMHFEKVNIDLKLFLWA